MKEFTVPSTCNHELHLMPKVFQIFWDERHHTVSSKSQTTWLIVFLIVNTSKLGNLGFLGFFGLSGHPIFSQFPKGDFIATTVLFGDNIQN